MKTEAQKTYEKLQAELLEKINALQNMIENHEAKFEQNPNNWGYVGDLNRALDLINEVKL